MTLIVVCSVFELRVTSIKHKISISVIIKTSQSYRFYNRVHSRIILEKTGVKWDTGFGFGSSRQWHPKAKENKDRIFTLTKGIEVLSLRVYQRQKSLCTDQKNLVLFRL